MKYPACTGTVLQLFIHTPTKKKPNQHKVITIIMKNYGRIKKKTKKNYINFHLVKEIYLQSLSHTIEHPQSLELEKLKTNLKR